MSKSKSCETCFYYYRKNHNKHKSVYSALHNQIIQIESSEEKSFCGLNPNVNEIDSFRPACQFYKEKK